MVVPELMLSMRVRVGIRCIEVLKMKTIVRKTDNIMRTMKTDIATCLIQVMVKVNNTYMR